MTHLGQILTDLSYYLLLNQVSKGRPIELDAFGLSAGTTSSARLSHINMELRRLIRHLSSRVVAVLGGLVFMRKHETQRRRITHVVRNALDRLYVILYTLVPMRTKLIKELEEYRLSNRISQEKLAKVLGVTFVTVNRWLNGHRKPSKIHEYHIRKLIAGEHR